MNERQRGGVIGASSKNVVVRVALNAEAPRHGQPHRVTARATLRVRVVTVLILSLGALLIIAINAL